jgi:hypothetical protein
VQTGIGIRLGMLPTTRRYLDWISWESYVVGGACGVPDRGGVSKIGSNM